MITLRKDDVSYIVRKFSDDVIEKLNTCNGLDDLTMSTPKGGCGDRPQSPQGD